MSFLTKFILLVGLTLAAYSFMIGAPFRTLDDEFSIVGNPLIKDATRWVEIFTQGYFNDQTYYRPLTNIAYMLEYQMHGLNAFYFNLDSVLLHIINALLVWMLVGFLVGAEAAFWTAFLFAIHPIHWEAVGNISGRAILLSTFFMLSSTLFFIRQRHWLALVCFTLGLLCKESTVVLPGMLIVYCYFFRRQWSWLIPWALLGVLYMYLRHALGITQFLPWRNAHEYVFGFLTFLRSLLTDIRTLIFPVDLHFDRSQKLIMSWQDPMLVVTIVFWVGVAALLWYYRRRITSLVLMGFAWIALALFPVSQVISTIGVQPGTISSADHFLYFACVPIFMLIVSYLIHFRRPLVRFCYGAVLCFFWIMLIEQNIYASSEKAMLKRSLEIQPDNARLHASIGLIYALEKAYVAASGHFERAVANDPNNMRYRISWGRSLFDQGDAQKALMVYDTIADAPEYRQMLNKNKQDALNALSRKE